MRYFEGQPFEFDIFLGGPPDRRSPFPYREQLKAAFPQLSIYDWETYKGEDYQEHNDQMMQKSLMMVSLAPGFPMPAIGPEIGYFYAFHEKRIKNYLEGLSLGLEFDPEKSTGHAFPALKLKTTEPVKPLILIWPESVQPDFTKKTLNHYCLIVQTVEEAVSQIRANLAAVEQREKHLREAARREAEAHFQLAQNMEEIRRGQNAAAANIRDMRFK